MAENPQFPPWFRDFHDQKDLVKAFYTWLEMMDNKANQERRERTQANRGRDLLDYERLDRIGSCGWVSFHILLTSFLDFLQQHGWVLYRTKKQGDYPDLEDSIMELRNLDLAWMGVTDACSPLTPRTDFITSTMEKWAAWLPYMPAPVQEAWAQMEREKEATDDDRAGESHG